MRRIFHVVAVFALVSAIVASFSVAAAQGPEFTLGFRAFADLFPDLVGQPLENERHDLIGNGFQQTDTGLLVWHRLDNVVDFTNGAETFVLTASGLLQRANDQRFQFEAVREPLEAQLDQQLNSLVQQQPVDLEAQIQALISQFEAQLEAQEAQLEQPEALQPAPAPAGPATFMVTIENLTGGQPFSPPVAATHQDGVHLFQVGATASDQIAAVARDGNPVPLFTSVNGAAGITEAVTIGGIGPGQTGSFEITANPADKFSMATMLSCTNDGFTGLDSVDLPGSGSQVLSLVSWDAGRENNTERIEDLIDQCGIPFGTPTNRDAEVATIPFDPIAPHPGILGVGDLDPATRGWTEPVGRVTIQRIGPALRTGR